MTKSDHSIVTSPVASNKVVFKGFNASRVNLQQSPALPKKGSERAGKKVRLESFILHALADYIHWMAVGEGLGSIIYCEDLTKEGILMSMMTL